MGFAESEQQTEQLSECDMGFLHWVHHFLDSSIEIITACLVVGGGTAAALLVKRHFKKKRAK